MQKLCAYRPAYLPLVFGAAGDGLYGGLGHGDTEIYESPTKIQALEGNKLTSIAAGWAHSAVTLQPAAVVVEV
jgi:hypothetical protein